MRYTLKSAEYFYRQGVKVNSNAFILFKTTESNISSTSRQISLLALATHNL